MTFVSYAKNFEDFMLWRALGHIRNGFYMDIGAKDSVVKSVSHAFSEQGWHGVHYEVVTEIVFEYKTIHWLRISAENFKNFDFVGWNSQDLRPWVVIIETKEINNDSILLQADYQFVYFDGLNRFYIAKEHPELAQAFSYPPSALDDFFASEYSPFFCSQPILKLKEEEKKLNQLLAQAHTQNKILQNRLENALSEIKKIHASRSWQITKPMRLLISLWKKRHSLKTICFNVVKKTESTRRIKTSTTLSSREYEIFNQLKNTFKKRE